MRIIRAAEATLYIDGRKVATNCRVSFHKRKNTLTLKIFKKLMVKKKKAYKDITGHAEFTATLKKCWHV